MKLEDFSFELPPELIAQTPASPRDSARLLVYDRKSKSIADAVFRDIADFLPNDATIVLNKAKVDKARLQFGKLEIFIVETYNDTTLKAMVRPGKKFKPGNMVELTADISARVTDVDSDGLRTLELNVSLDDPQLDPFRLTPLPPYIEQNEDLADEYQTVYASDPGSKAAPTAGLHFTPQLLAKLGKTHQFAEVTLNVSLGTFAKIGEDEIKAKKLHTETYSIDAATAKMLRSASHITAIGTTTVRTLESACDNGFQPIEQGSTDIFIQPGDKLQAVDSLVTNFHLPSTSLLMLVAAFTGREELLRIYQHAIDQKYRFYSFGDAMLIL